MLLFQIRQKYYCISDTPACIYEYNFNAALHANGMKTWLILLFASKRNQWQLSTRQAPTPLQYSELGLGLNKNNK